MIFPFIHFPHSSNPMEFHCSSSSSSYSLTRLKTHHKNLILIPFCPVSYKRSTRVSFKPRISYNCKWGLYQRRWLFRTKLSSKGSVENSSDDPPIVEVEDKKKGTIAGAVALIIGTSIGSGILALPNKASPAGIIPSSISMVVCWGFLLIEAILLVELNVGLRRKRRKREDGKGIEVISIRTMAQDTLGDWGGNLATVTYVFLGYTSMVAYASKSGEILFHLLNLPESVSGCVFTLAFTLFISIGGTETTDQVNQWLTASMIGLLLAIEVVCITYGGWPGLMEGGGDWGKVPDTVPVMIFSLVYHDLAPVLCAYLGGDIARLRTSILIGSFVPLVGLLVWDAIALGLSAHQADQVGVDPIELLVNVGWTGVPLMVQAFSLVAVGTSLIGTLLGFSEFFKEQIRNLETERRRTFGYRRSTWLGRHRRSLTAMTMAVGPALVVSATVPDAFSAATDIAGGYCMTMLYGVLPPAMVWAVRGKKGLSVSKTVLLVGVAAFGCGIVLEQLLHDLKCIID
ncbi:Tyrosine-specific transport system 1 [Linum perenne]